MLDELVNKISDIGRRLYKIETAKQPQLGDWNTLLATDFVDLTGANLLSSFVVSGFTPSSKFTAGDKIRIRWSIYESYYVIVLVDDTTSTVYVQFMGLVNITAVTEISIVYSKLQHPTGFYDDADITVATRNLTSVLLNHCKVYFNGSIIICNYEILGNSTTVSGMEADLPITLAGKTAYMMKDRVSVTVNGIAAIARQNATGIEVVRADGSNWAVIASWRANFEVSYILR